MFVRWCRKDPRTPEHHPNGRRSKNHVTISSANDHYRQGAERGIVRESHDSTSSPKKKHASANIVIREKEDEKEDTKGGPQSPMAYTLDLKREASRFRKPALEASDEEVNVDEAMSEGDGD
jgi:hypothetical protein